MMNPLLLHAYSFHNNVLQTSNFPLLNIHDFLTAIESLGISYLNPGNRHKTGQLRQTSVNQSYKI